MLIDRSHLSWAFFSGISLIAGTVSYVMYAWSTPKGPSGGSGMGLLYGVIGTAMMLFAGLLAGRKPLRNMRLGSAQFWLKGHIWLGTLSIPFILFHSGFGWGGTLEQCLWYSLAIVAVSGFFGLAIQQVLPRLLWRQIPLETFEGQTAYQCDRLTLIADVKVASLCESALNAPDDSLHGHSFRLVEEYDSIMKGPGARNEKNARKLMMLQQVLPLEVRDFFWAMAKYAKSELKAIPFEGDFPELLAKTYLGLRAEDSANLWQPVPETAQLPRDSEAIGVMCVAGATPAVPDKISTPQNVTDSKSVAVKGAERRLSPMEIMKQKAAEKAAAGKVAAIPAAATDVAAPPPVVPQTEAPAAAPAKLSPLEIMKQKAAEKAAAAAGTVVIPVALSDIATPAPVVPQIQAPGLAPAKISPPSSEPDTTPSAARRSPLDMLKKAGDKASPAGRPEGSVVTSPTAARPASPATPEKRVAPTAEEKHLLRSVYLEQVRPFLTESRTRRSVRKSALASDVQSLRLFHDTEALLPAALHPILNELKEACEIRRQIEQQRRILRWMHWWLMVHVPVSVALLVFLAAHVVMALRVVPFTQ